MWIPSSSSKLNTTVNYQISFTINFMAIIREFELKGKTCKRKKCFSQCHPEAYRSNLVPSVLFLGKQKTLVIVFFFFNAPSSRMEFSLFLNCQRTTGFELQGISVALTSRHFGTRGKVLMYCIVCSLLRTLNRVSSAI